MQLYIDTASNSFIESEAFPRALLSASLKRRDVVSVVVSFVTNGEIVPITAGTTAKLGIKPLNAYTSNYWAYAGSWTIAANSLSASFALNLNTTELTNAFTEESEPASLDAMLEIELTSSGLITSSNTLPVTIFNDVIRGNEGTTVVANLPALLSQATDTQHQPSLPKKSGVGNVIAYNKDGTSGSLNGNSLVAGATANAYRLSVAEASSSRTGSDIALVQGTHLNTRVYFTGRVRGKLDFTTAKGAFIQVAFPVPGYGSFQFGLGYGSNVSIDSLSVGSHIPEFPDSGIGFRLTRSGSSLLPTIIGRTTGSTSSFFVSSTGTPITDLASAYLFYLEFLPPTTLRLFILQSVTSSNLRSQYNPTLICDYTSATVFQTSTGLNNVNWLAGITPLGLASGMTYDIAPPILLY